ncbi:hypothetical protein BT63DRAFT_101822 [Microthyrium microscopicum]|uniref:Cora-domain-containing protein n=1 Tax=Microthyrium microscopicum TaxID=703497 RepID=A0A6A6TVL6_9PEZI|nr:hypothetical protein BT63DRAFT_101822 [Microthyrium microscopicum]
MGFLKPKWPKIFSERRKLEGNVLSPHVTNREIIDPMENNFQRFFEERICSDIQPWRGSIFQEKFQNCKIPCVTCHVKSAWLHEKNICEPDGLSNPSINSVNEGKFSPIELKKRLSKLHVPYGRRTLVYIPNAGGCFCQAITDTAPAYQRPALKEALWNYYQDLDPFLKFNVQPTAGVANFHFHIALPYHRVRIYTPEEYEKRDERQQFVRKGKRSWTRLSPSHTWNDRSKYLEMQKAIFSLTVSGTDCFRWCAYCLNDEVPEIEEIENLDESVLSEDPIAAGGEHADADKSTNDPREYCLCIWEIRIDEVFQESSHSYFYLEQGVEKLLEEASHDTARLLLHHRAHMKEHFARRLYDRSNQLLPRLKELAKSTSKLLDDWKKFEAPNGSINLFDPDSFPEDLRPIIQNLLTKLQSTYELLEKLRDKVIDSENRCSNVLKSLRHDFDMEENETTRHTYNVATFSIWIISPLTLATSFYSMHDLIMPYPLNIWTFCATVLAVVILFLIFSSICVLFGVLKIYFLSMFSRKTQANDVKKAKKRANAGHSSTFSSCVDRLWRRNKGTPRKPMAP